MERIREQEGSNVLFLAPCEPFPFVKYKNGKRRTVTIVARLFYQWLRDENDATSVLGEDSIVLTSREYKAAIKNGLFKSFNLF